VEKFHNDDVTVTSSTNDVSTKKRHREQRSFFRFKKLSTYRTDVRKWPASASYCAVQ